MQTTQTNTVHSALWHYAQSLTVPHNPRSVPVRKGRGGRIKGESAARILSRRILGSDYIPFAPIPFGACSVPLCATIYPEYRDREGNTVQITNDWDAIRYGLASIADPAMIQYKARKALTRAVQGANKYLGGFDRAAYRTDAEQIVADVVAAYYVRQSGQKPNGKRSGDVRFSFDRAIARAVQNRNKGTKHRPVICLVVNHSEWPEPVQIPFDGLKVSEQITYTRTWSEWADADPINRTIYIHEIMGEGKARTDAELAAMRGFALPVRDSFADRDSIRHGQQYQTDTERQISVLEALGCSDAVIGNQTGTKPNTLAKRRERSGLGRDHRFVNRRRRVA